MLILLFQAFSLLTGKGASWKLPTGHQLTHFRNGVIIVVLALKVANPCPKPKVHRVIHYCTILTVLLWFYVGRLQRWLQLHLFMWWPSSNPSSNMPIGSSPAVKHLPVNFSNKTNSRRLVCQLTFSSPLLSRGGLQRFGDVFHAQPSTDPRPRTQSGQEAPRQHGAGRGQSRPS